MHSLAPNCNVAQKFPEDHEKQCSFSARLFVLQKTLFLLQQNLPEQQTSDKNAARNLNDARTRYGISEVAAELGKSPHRFKCLQKFLPS